MTGQGHNGGMRDGLTDSSNSSDSVVSGGPEPDDAVQSDAAVATLAPPDGPRRVELEVGGMTCAVCANRVEKKLNKRDGVVAAVNYATGRATVDAIGAVSDDDLQQTVEAAGYSAVPSQDAPGEEIRAGRYRDEVRSLLVRLAVAVVLFIPVMDLSIMFAVVPSTRFSGWQWLLLALSIPVVTFSAWPFHRAALTNLRHGTVTMDTLVSTGIAAATAWSIYTIFTPSMLSDEADGVWDAVMNSSTIYFEVATGVTAFVLFGRFLEARAKRRAGDTLNALAALAAKDVTILTRAGVEMRIPADRLGIDDVFVVRPGETIATDAVVQSGGSLVDASAMTGEARPVEVGQGDDVLGGTVALSGRLVARASAVGAETRLAEMARMVADAQSGKADVQRLADRVSSVFVPTVFVLAAVTFLGWWLLGHGSVADAANPALAVLIIACPCALGLATPTALMVASGRGAQLGIFIKGPQALEATRRIDTVVFDKTGTITEGGLSVQSVVFDAGDAVMVREDESLRLAAGVENASEHAVAAALVRYVRDEGLTVPEVTGFEATAGLGARGTVEGREVQVGRLRALQEAGVDVSADLRAAVAEAEASGRTTALVAVDGAAVAAFALADSIKSDAAEAVRRLRKAGLHTVMLTGDGPVAAGRIGDRVGIDEYHAGLMPGDKVAMVRRLQEQGRRVAMVGDGVNDGPALATADLGMAVATGTDVAIGAADVVLVRRRLTIVPDSVDLAAATLRTIRGNLIWAFGYNVAAIPIAASGLLNPIVSAAAMAFSSFFVVSNSLRLRRFGASVGVEATPAEADSMEAASTEVAPAEAAQTETAPAESARV